MLKGSDGPAQLYAPPKPGGVDRAKQGESRPSDRAPKRPVGCKAGCGGHPSWQGQVPG